MIKTVRPLRAAAGMDMDGLMCYLETSSFIVF